MHRIYPPDVRYHILPPRNRRMGYGWDSWSARLSEHARHKVIGALGITQFLTRERDLTPG